MQEHPPPLLKYPPMDWYLPDGNPVFWQVMRCQPRGRHWYPAVGIYLLGLGSILLVVCFTAVVHWQGDLHAWARMSRQAWQAMLCFQGCFFCLLAPGLTAGNLTGATARKAEDALLLTPLTPSQLVYGQFRGAAALLILIYLIGLPLTAVLLTIGGLSPLELLGGGLIILSSTLFLAALGTLASCKTARTTFALALAYGYAALWAWVFLLFLFYAALDDTLFILSIISVVFLFRATKTVLEGAVRALTERRNTVKEQGCTPMTGNWFNSYHH